MPKFDSTKAVFSSDATKLAKLLHLNASTPDNWEAADLPAMFRHQLSAPLNFDLRTMAKTEPEAKTLDKTLTRSATERIRSFRDLLFHRKPPLELLTLSKEFFKLRTRACEKSSPEWQVAYLFYLLSVIVAKDRYPAISKL